MEASYWPRISNSWTSVLVAHALLRLGWNQHQPVLYMKLSSIGSDDILISSKASGNQHNFDESSQSHGSDTTYTRNQVLAMGQWAGLFCVSHTVSIDQRFCLEVRSWDFIGTRSCIYHLIFLALQDTNPTLCFRAGSSQGLKYSSIYLTL